MAFTTWTALKEQMLDDLASGKTTMGEYEVSSGGTVRRFNFRSYVDWMKIFQMVEQRAAAETGSVVGRTFAKNGGGGRW